MPAPAKRKINCGGIKASRVILDSNRGGVHRGAPAVAHLFLEFGQIPTWGCICYRGMEAWVMKLTPLLFWLKLPSELSPTPGSFPGANSGDGFLYPSQIHDAARR
jgi:hypothetical protein